MLFVSGDGRLRMFADDGFCPHGIPGSERSQNFPMLALRMAKPPRKHILEEIAMQAIPVIQHLAHQGTNQSGA